MFSFCRDIAFAEQLKFRGFDGAGVIILADDRNFWAGKGDGIYQFFRSGRQLTGIILKPTGLKDEQLVIGGNYTIEWEQITHHMRCAIIEAQ
jgi:hypothetical protein